MKIAVCTLLYLATLAALPAADTAYTALRTVGKQKGADALSHVVEVRGRNGVPQPEIWKVTLDEPSARGGLREVEVEHSHIAGERTPTAHPTESAMNFNQLNLDSDGVFTIVNEQAGKKGISFDHADYVLNSAGGAAPVWHVDLFEGRRGRVASFAVAADSGAVLKTDLIGPVGPARPIAEEPHPSRPPSGPQSSPQPPPPGAVGPHDNAFETDIIDEEHPISSVGDFFGRVKHHFQKRGKQIDNFFKWADREVNK